MAKQVQQRRGTTVEHNSFTGAVGEITVDTSKDTAVVHDGSTVGGHPLALEKNVPNGSNSSITDDGTNVTLSGSLTGKNIQNRWTYLQVNSGTNVNHPILMSDLNDELDSNGAGANCYAEITVVTISTNTNTMYCKYSYSNNRINDAASLNHIRGTNGASGNRPYMVLDGQVPQWKMNHSSGYTVRVVVELVTGQELR